MVWVLSNGVEDIPLQPFLLSSLYSFGCIFPGTVWIDKLIIVLKGFISMFNKETGKRHFLTFHSNGCKEEKKCFINKENTTEKI